MTPASFLRAAPVADALSGTRAALRRIGDAAVWLLDHGLLVALATAAAAWIAWEAHRREERRIEERMGAADARIAGLAFPVRRTLEKSLDRDWFEDDGKAQRSRAQDLHRGYVDNDRRVEDMLAEAASASPDVAADVRAGSRPFWRAAQVLVEAAGWVVGALLIWFGGLGVGKLIAWIWDGFAGPS